MLKLIYWPGATSTLCAKITDVIHFAFLPSANTKYGPVCQNTQNTPKRLELDTRSLNVQVVWDLKGTTTNVVAQYPGVSAWLIHHEVESPDPITSSWHQDSTWIRDIVERTFGVLRKEPCRCSDRTGGALLFFTAQTRRPRSQLSTACCTTLQNTAGQQHDTLELKAEEENNHWPRKGQTNAAGLHWSVVPGCHIPPFQLSAHRRRAAPWLLNWRQRVLLCWSTTCFICWGFIRSDFFPLFFLPSFLN